MIKEISNRLYDYAKDNESIEAIFYNEEDHPDSFIHIYTIVNQVIIGKLEEELLDLFPDTIMVNREKSDFMVAKDIMPYTKLNIYTSDNLKLTESVISYEYADDFIKTLGSLPKILYTKPGFERIEKPSEKTLARPKEYEVMLNIKNFFARAYETSLYINEKDKITACLKMEEVRENLLNMINFYIKNKYSYTLDMGDDGQKLGKTLEYDLKEDFLLTFSHDDLMDIYFSLFKACVLFRKIAMQVCRDLSYPYPKEIDVNTLKVLRKNYKKLEAFIN